MTMELAMGPRRMESMATGARSRFQGHAVVFILSRGIYRVSSWSEKIDETISQMEGGRKEAVTEEISNEEKRSFGNSSCA